MSDLKSSGSATAIAIIGMAGRFPGARNLSEFWQNLREGRESISTFADSELELTDDDVTLALDPRYVKRQAILDDVDMFDAAFFGYTPREAELADPQQRLFLQCAHEALETAGYDPERFDGHIGVFGGGGFSHYLFANLLSNRDLIDSIGFFQTSIRNRADHLATNVAYKLNLKGPAVTVQTACSTSLVAVHMACQSLINYECDMAFAGGVSISLPQKIGYLYRDGGILSPDGHCRAFDARAQGTVTGNGVAIVVLKRLQDALRDRDNIEAVILGSAIGNDGSLKAGYAAPSVDGQAQVIAEAQSVAGVEAETITYIETHGTGTPMGDPIEIAALTQVFRKTTQKQGFCAIGSLKTNIGHLDAASGIAGLIKTALSIKHKMLPPSLHYERPNPEIEFSNSPFFVNASLKNWDVKGPRRAGVSSFGIGGTNVHAILEEPPEVDSGKETRSCQLLLLSAKTGSALESATRNLAAMLKAPHELNLADLAYTLQVGRRELNHRRAIVCRERADALHALQTLDPSQALTGFHETKQRPVVFMFPGQGAQYVTMGRGLYVSEPVFREQVNHCVKLMGPHIGFDLLDVLNPKSEGMEDHATLLQTEVAQPALFVIEYSLAHLWMQWGIQPKAMIGHSIGEYVAACLSGVLSLEDALRLVAMRGRLMQKLPQGAMLSVPQPEQAVKPLLKDGLSLAAVNGPETCVVAGPNQLIEELENDLAGKGVACRRLSTSHAFHSSMMDPILGSFRDLCRQISFHQPKLPYISNLSGTWITKEEVTNPEYWVRHLRETVRFHNGISELLQDPDSIFLEVGPGTTLASLVRRNPHRAAGQVVLNSLRHPDDPAADEAFLLATMGKLWIAGVQVDWSGFYRQEQRRRVPLPLYPFELQRYWIEARRGSKDSPDSSSLEKRTNVAEWFYVPSWKRVPLVQTKPALEAPWLVFLDRYGVGLGISEQLQRQGAEVFTVEEGRQFARQDRAFQIRPESGEDYEVMMSSLHQGGKFPARIVHLWNLIDSHDAAADEVDFDRSFWSPVFLARAVGALGNGSRTEFLWVSNHLYDVTGNPVLHPERATLLGPCRVIPQEYPNILCRHIDLDIVPNQDCDTLLLSRLLSEFVSAPEDVIVAYRSGYRWVQSFEPLRLNRPDETAPALRAKGTYLITGGLGGIGLVFAEQLAQSVQARLILTGRSRFPARTAWNEWLQNHNQEDPTSAKIRKLQSLEGMGAEVLVLTADVSDAAQMQNAIASARERFGTIHGVIHAAGVPGGGIIQLKTRAAAAAVLAPKVKGTMVLVSALGNTPLDFFVACSSRASILGGFGQVDYCAAGAFMDVFAHYSHSVGATPITSVNWDAWQDVGMLARKAAEWGIGAEKTTTTASVHPLLGSRIVESPQREVFTSIFNPAAHWVLDEHRIRGESVMPGVAYLEMARAAAEMHGSEGIEIRDAFFLKPLSFHYQEQREVKVILEKEKGGYVFRVSSSRHGDANPEWHEHAVANINFFHCGTARRHDLDAIAQRCNRRRVFDDNHWIDEGLGPRWQVCRHAFIGESELLAFLQLPEEFLPELEQLKLYPTLLDRAAVLGKQFLVEEGTFLPLGYRRLRIRSPLEKNIYAHLRFRADQESKRETIAFDIVLMNEQGEELVTVEEFSEKKVRSLSVPGKIFGSPQDRRKEDGLAAAQQTPYPRGVVASAFAASLKHGIAPREGQAAFRYVLGLRDLPQIIVSTSDFQAAILEAKRSEVLGSIVAQSAKLLPAQSLHPRPAMQTTYAAPTNELEKKMVEVWGRVLGIAEVGIHDNYFDLGGDSVQAIQIIAQTNQEGFQLAPQQLFQRQTVAELAAVAATSMPAVQERAEMSRSTSSPSEFPLAGLDEKGLQELAEFLEETDRSRQ